jgi:dTDP-4-amino-4,6-dideoxygalactose transaminase
MEPIQMVDLKNQYLRIKAAIDESILQVLDSSAFINGKPVQTFAESLSTYLGVKHVIPCANGTDALQIALMSLDLQPGDEVITPSFTYIATTEVVSLLRLKPVFVEVDPDSFCIHPDAIRQAITSKTRAIVPVHLYGHAAHMEEVMAISNEYNIPVVEDNAQAIGCQYRFSDGSVKKTGTIGTIGTTSFFPSKNLGAYGDGGAIFTNDDTLAEKLRKIANHGQSIRYYHDIVGCNSRLDTIQAAVLNIKLKYLDEYISARRAAADRYDKAFSGHERMQIPTKAPYSDHVYHQYTIAIKGEETRLLRDGLIQHLAAHKIPSMIYYPVPGHRQKMFESQCPENLNLPVTDWLTERVFSLPMHTELTHEQQDYIIENVLSYFDQYQS